MMEPNCLGSHPLSVLPARQLTHVFDFDSIDTVKSHSLIRDIIAPSHFSRGADHSSYPQDHGP